MSTTSNFQFHSAEAFFTHGLKPVTPLSKTEECSICQQSWTDHPAGAVSTLCNHEFHSDCLTLWITIGRGKRTACPLCRRNFFTEAPHNDDQAVAAAEEQDYDSEYEDDDDSWEDESVRTARLTREAAAATYLRTHQSSIVEFVRKSWESRGRCRRSSEPWGRLIASILYAHRHSTRDVTMRAACRDAEFEVSFIVIDTLLVWGDLSLEDCTGLENLLDRVESAFAAKKMQDAGRR
jgi:hypothetical protein